jgi:NTE family protein
LERAADRKMFNIIQLIYHAKRAKSSIKDFEFSYLAMTEHWATGYHDAVRTLRHPEIFEPVGPANTEGVFTFDIAVDGRS